MNADDARPTFSAASLSGSRGWGNGRVRVLNVVEQSLGHMILGGSPLLAETHEVDGAENLALACLSCGDRHVDAFPVQRPCDDRALNIGERLPIQSSVSDAELGG